MGFAHSPVVFAILNYCHFANIGLVEVALEATVLQVRPLCGREVRWQPYPKPRFAVGCACSELHLSNGYASV